MVAKPRASGFRIGHELIIGSTTYKVVEGKRPGSHKWEIVRKYKSGSQSGPRMRANVGNHKLGDVVTKTIKRRYEVVQGKKGLVYKPLSRTYQVI